MIVGWWENTGVELTIGRTIRVTNMSPEGAVHTIPARVISSASREDYIAQQEERGYLNDEQNDSQSVLNRATHFYHVSVD